MTAEHLEILRQGREKAMARRKLLKKEKESNENLEKRKKELEIENQNIEIEELEEKIEKKRRGRPKKVKEPAPEPAPAPAPKSEQNKLYTMNDIEQASLQAVIRYDTLRKNRKAIKKKENAVSDHKKELLDIAKKASGGDWQNVAGRFHNCY
jgi:hypothetical protein